MFVNQEYYFSTTENNFFPRTENRECFDYWTQEAFKEAESEILNHPDLFNNLGTLKELTEDFIEGFTREKNVSGAKTSISDKINYCDYFLAACFKKQEKSFQDFIDLVDVCLDDCCYHDPNDPFVIFRTAELIGLNVEKRILIEIAENSYYDSEIHLCAANIVLMRNWLHTVESRVS